MNTRRPAALLALTLSSACAVTSVTPQPARLGTPTTLAVMEASLPLPGRVVLERVVAADWKVDRAGLVNLEHPEARAAGLEDGDEPIQIYMYVLRHPEHGSFLVDSGVQAALRTGEDTILSGLVASAMNMETLVVHRDTAAWLAAEATPPAGVLLTHLHVDHVLGLADLPGGTPVYVGPGEAAASAFVNLFVQGTTDRALEGKDLLELAFGSEPSGDFDGVLDLFGDQSVFALHVAGHTPGSLAYLVRTPEGPVLLVGDTCHTAFGWAHGVEPGDFTADHEANAKKLMALRALVARHPEIVVHLGHQPVAPAPVPAPVAAAE
jgi:N-acyl homoserine lactone hydrolase